MSTRCPLALLLAAGLAVPAVLADTAPAGDLPLKAVTLYRSGVGAFEHLGTVTGNETIRLRFDADRINDILKSMVLADLGGGQPVGATYRPNEPLARRLEDFRINPLAASSVVDLMRQIIGTEVELKTAGGTVAGVVLGVEQRPVTIGSGTAAKVTKDWAVTLVTKSGVSTVPQAEIRSFEILDESLAAELSRALAVVAQHRDDRFTDVDVAFAGRGERSVAISYTHEAPVWKTSYRLILPAGTDAQPSLQGWAIVENDTDEDWQGVRLSLASGRPVSFIMDLQTPLILHRPVLPAPVLAMLGPTVYAGGRVAHKSSMPLDVMDAPSRDEAAREQSAPRSRLATAAPEQQIGNGALAVDVWESRMSDLQSAASAGDVGEQFIYTIDAPVSIEKGGSSMLPIISGPIDGRRVTIYSALATDPHPMLGVELTNNTGLHLMPGPIAVYDAGAYAGDAQIGHVARNDERLLSYAVDHDLEASREQENRQDVRTIRIVKGMILRTNVSRQTTTYTFTNHNTDARTVLIEHPRAQGWEIVGDAKPIEETDAVLRFETTVEAGADTDLAVTLERVWSQSLSTDAIGLDELFGFVRTGAASQAVFNAVQKASSIQARINDAQRALAANKATASEIAQDQDRIRRNLNTVNRQSDLYTRYMRTLESQEDRLETLHERRADLESRLQQARAELRDYLSDLNVS